MITANLNPERSFRIDLKIYLPDGPAVESEARLSSSASSPSLPWEMTRSVNSEPEDLNISMTHCTTIRDKVGTGLCLNLSKNLRTGESAKPVLHCCPGKRTLKPLTFPSLKLTSATSRHPEDANYQNDEMYLTRLQDRAKDRPNCSGSFPFPFLNRKG